MTFTELRRMYRDYYYMNLGMTADAIRKAGSNRALRPGDFADSKKWAREMCLMQLKYRTKHIPANVKSNYVILRDGVAF